MPKFKPRAIARFCGIFPVHFFVVLFGHNDPSCQPCKLRKPCIDCCGHVLYYHGHNRWDLYYTWVQMLLQMGPLLCLGPNAIRRDLYYAWVQMLNITQMVPLLCLGPVITLMPSKGRLVARKFVYCIYMYKYH